MVHSEYADPGPIYAFLWETFGGKIVPPTKLVTGHRKSGSYAWSRLFCAWFSGSFPPRVFRFTNLRFFWKTLFHLFSHSQTGIEISRRHPRFPEVLVDVKEN